MNKKETKKIIRNGEKVKVVRYEGTENWVLEKNNG